MNAAGRNVSPFSVRIYSSAQPDPWKKLYSAVSDTSVCRGDWCWPDLQLLVHLQEVGKRILTRAIPLILFILTLPPWYFVAEIILVDSLMGRSGLQVHLEAGPGPAHPELTEHLVLPDPVLSLALQPQV